LAQVILAQDIAILESAHFKRTLSLAWAVQ